MGSLLLLNEILTQENIFFPKIVKNIAGEMLTFLNGKYYVLKEDILPLKPLVFAQVKYQNRYLLPLNQLKSIQRSNWVNLWEKKVDYFEYQKKHIFQKFPYLVENLDYFIGLAENAIAYVKEINASVKKSETDQLTFTRRRVEADEKLSAFYDPLCFVIDHKARDLSEYIKSYFFQYELSTEEWKSWIRQIQMSDYGWGLFFGRMLFPSFFFDLYEKIVNRTTTVKEIDKILEKVDEYQEFLFLLQEEIHLQHKIPEVDWLSKRKEVL